MLIDKLWSKLKVILLEDRGYNKSEHRQTMEGILYPLSFILYPLSFIAYVLAALGVIYLNALVYGIRFTVDFYFGLEKAY